MFDDLYLITNSCVVENFLKIVCDLCEMWYYFFPRFTWW